MESRWKSIVLLAAVGVFAVGFSAYRAFNPPISPAAARLAAKIKFVELPAAFGRLTPGMTQDQVVAIIGKPMSVSSNAKYERKTAAEWQELRRQVDGLSRGAQSSDAPADMHLLKLNAALSHRIKTLWRYQPNANMYAVVSFDDGGNVVSVGSGSVSHVPPVKHQ